MRRKKLRLKRQLANRAGIANVTLSAILGDKSTKWPTAIALALITDSNFARWSDAYNAYMNHVVDRLMYSAPESDDDDY